MPLHFRVLWHVRMTRWLCTHVHKLWSVVNLHWIFSSLPNNAEDQTNKKCKKKEIPSCFY